MNLKNISPKLYAGVAILGLWTTAYLAAKETPKAIQLIEEAKAKTLREKIKAAVPAYIPAGASALITTATIIGGFNDLIRRNTELALAYGFGQTALRLYSERTPTETRQQVTAEMMRMQEPPGSYILVDDSLDAKDQINVCFDYLSGRYFHASQNQIKRACDEFNENVLKVNGRGSLSQLYSCFHNPDELPPAANADLLGWRYVNGEGAVPMVNYEPDKYGNPCMIFDFYNPPQYDYNNEFA